VASIRGSVSEVAGVAFDVRLPLPPRPFEFGFLELTILLLFTIGIVGHRLRGPLRRRARWAGQILGLVILGFWENSPITLAKITAFLSGYLPDPRTSVAIYLLLAGFLLTSIFFGRNLYCLYACPFGAAQRVVGAIGGVRLKVPPWLARAMGTARNVVVFAALFMAFLTLRPALASYEPFAALFALHGTTLQWFLLFIVLTASLLIQMPWCSFFCPMVTFELVVLDTKRWMKSRPGEEGEHE
jgi:polyferredoxin